jgi:excisionase family DNA binding protein
MKKTHLDTKRIRAALSRLDRLALEHPELIQPGETSTDEWIKTLEGAMKDIYTIQEAAEYFKVHPQTLRRAIAAGKLKAAKLGKDYRISKADLIAYYNAMGGVRLEPDDEIEAKAV